MRIEHINCGSMCPVGGVLTFGGTQLVCHCLVIETERHGLVLVDTGLGMRDVLQPETRLSPFFINMNRMALREDETAVRHVGRLGYKASDVQHIILTHLDFDHAGGVNDFPNATLHVLRVEADAARDERKTFIGMRRYRPQQWNHALQWRLYESVGEPWFGFRSVRQLDGLPPEIMLVPLVGHTRGHCGVAIRQKNHWLLHAGDAYFSADEIAPLEHHCPLGMRVYQRMMEVDHDARMYNQWRLRKLRREHSTEVHIFCSHDKRELEALRAKRQQPTIAKPQHGLVEDMPAQA